MLLAYNSYKLWMLACTVSFRASSDTVDIDSEGAVPPLLALEDITVSFNTSSK